MKKLTLILALLIVPTMIFAKTVVADVTLIMKDGTIKTGVAKMPEVADKELEFKSDAATKKYDKIACADIVTIKATYEDGSKGEFDYLFYRTPYQIYKRKDKLSSQAVWLTVIKRGRAMTLYCSSTSTKYYVVSGGGMKAGMPGGTFYFCKRTGESFASGLAEDSSIPTMGSEDKMFRDSGTVYFEDDKAIAEKIASKEWKYKDLETIVDQYNKTHK